MKSLINFLNKFNEVFENILSSIKIPYPKSLFLRINNFFSEVYQSFLEKIRRFIEEKDYAKNLFEDLINKIFNWITISILITVSVVGFLIYQLDQRAFFEGKFSMAQLESLVWSKKPKFTNFEEREFFVPDVFVPVILKNRPDITRIYLDIKLRSSNKFIKIYFTENNFINMDKLVDRYLSTLGPIIPVFPLTDEGKNILKNKIKLETNELLKQLKIEGEIEEVIIQDILAA